MRNVLLLDTKINKDEALALLDEYSEWYEKQTGITPIFWVERRDFSQVPTTPDSDGDLKPTYKYRQALATDVHGRYGDYGTDNIVMMVHEDNFVFKGLWGVNWAYSHYKYGFQLVRWDKDNPANTFGTLNHEQDHMYDALILKEIGVDVRPLLKVADYDADVTHGRDDRFGYIRYQENAKTLKKLAPYLRKSFAERKRKHDNRVTKLTTVVHLLKQLVDLLSLWKNKVDSTGKKS